MSMSRTYKPGPKFSLTSYVSRYLYLARLVRAAIANCGDPMYPAVAQCEGPIEDRLFKGSLNSLQS